MDSGKTNTCLINSATLYYGRHFQIMDFQFFLVSDYYTQDSVQRHLSLPFLGHF